MDPIFRLLYYSEEFQKNSVANHAMISLSKNLQLVPKLSIGEIAELCNTNPMTISRLVRKLGYSNYAEFRSEAKEVLANYKYFNRNIPVNRIDSEKPAEAFLDYLEENIQRLRSGDVAMQIEKVCEALHKAERIHYYGPPFSSPYVMMLLHDLLVDGKTIFPNSTKESVLEDVKMLRETSLIFLEPSELSTDETIVRAVIEEAQDKGAKLVMLTDNHDPMLSFAQEINLTYTSDHTAFSALQSEILLNMLTMTYRKLYID